MKEFCCGDVVPGCTAVFHGANEQELFSKIGVHAHRDHGIREVSDDLIAKIRTLIRDVPAA